MEVFLDAARTFVREHSARAASLFARKIYAFIWFAPNVGAEYRGWQITLYVAWYIALLVLGVAGAATVWRGGGVAQRRRMILVGGAVFGLAALHALAAINMKHRVPLELVLSVLASAYVTRGIRLAPGVHAVR